MPTKMEEAFSNLATALINVTRRTHAGFVLAVVAVLDHDLQRCLLAEMRPLTARSRERLFSGYGPLSSLAAKIDIAFALRILSPESHAEFLKVKKIRNEFAHSKEPLSLDREPILALFRRLKRPEGASGGYAEVFLACALELDDRLERFLVSKGITDDIRPENL